MLDIDPSLQIAVLRTVLATRGIGPALALLNDRTNYRFTGLYKLSDNVMRAEHVFDRAAEHRTWLRAVPLGRSFCQYALQHGEFVIDRASTDSRLAKHPYSGLVESYYGRLLVRDGGTPWGTFIHFDMEPRRIETREVEFLRHAVPLFVQHLD